MSQQPHSGGTVTRSYRTAVPGAWWVALAVVPLVLAYVGRDSGGFWSTFLWSVVAFIVGALAAHALAGVLVPARSEAEAFADVSDGADAGAAPGGAR